MLNQNITKKLNLINLNSKDITTQNYLSIYQQLRLFQPSLSHQALFDLHCHVHDISHAQLTMDTKKLLIKQYQQLPIKHTALNPEIIHNYINEALIQAQLALQINEIPIGAIIVHQNKIIGRGHNQTKTHNNILKHAEIIAIEQAQKYLNNHRLDNCDLYVTIEPCLMCSGAIIHSRIKRVIFGAYEPKTGACRSQYQVFDNTQINHHCEVIGPVDNNEYSQLIKEFFRK